MTILSAFHSPHISFIVRANDGIDVLRNYGGTGTDNNQCAGMCKPIMPVFSKRAISF